MINIKKSFRNYITDITNKMALKGKKARIRRYPSKNIIDKAYADDQALLTNTPA